MSVCLYVCVSVCLYVCVSVCLCASEISQETQEGDWSESHKSQKFVKYMYNCCVVAVLSLKPKMMAILLLVVLLSHAAHCATEFVTREGSSLFLDGKVFRFSGANVFWLGLDEDVG